MSGHRLSRCCAAGCALLFALASAAETPDVVPDLDKVEGIQKLKAPPAARELLKRNGFVVVPRFYHQIFSPYIHEGLPPFVTTDSLHRTFHVIFEEQIKKLETALAGDVAAITEAMEADCARFFDQVKARVVARAPAPCDWLVWNYFRVARCLLGGTEAPADGPQGVAAELRLIRASAGVAKSPLFGYEIDYSQFKPRGFYTETPLLRRFFQAMSWYGNAAFRLASDDETFAAMLIAHRFKGLEGVRTKWKRIDQLYSHLIAPPDDLTPEEYATLLDGMDAAERKGELKGDRFEWFKKAAAQLRDPKINSMVLTPREMPRWRELGKGMCFFGKRYVPDSEVFMSLVHPSVPGRLWPSGLDVMAVLGSTRARELQHAAGEATLPGYGEGFSKSRKTLDDLLAAKDRSHYVETLRLAQTLLAPPGPEALPFMQTPAYTDKNLMTALALWTSLRHTWQLQAKQSVGVGLGMPEAGPPPGWIEPNFPFYEQLHRLITRTLEVLGPVEAKGTDRLKALDALVLKVLAIGRKQAAGEHLTPEDRCFFDVEFADELQSLHGTDLAPDTWMSLAADVHSQLLGGECLEEGIGGAMPIFVIVPRGTKQYLMVGGTYSHYEFRQPIAKRLTDEEWRERVSGGNLPPMPGWAGSFIAGFDAMALLKRIENGESVDDILYVTEPAVEAFLEKAIAPGGALDGKPNLSWAVEAYGRKAGRKAVPTLLKYYTHPDGPVKVKVKLPDGKVETREYDEGGPRAAGAAEALGDLARPEHLPVFEKIAVNEGERRARSAFNIIVAMNDKAAERSLTGLLRRVPPGAQWDILYRLEGRASRDATTAILDHYPVASDEIKAEMLDTLSTLWQEPMPPAEGWGSPRWPSEMDEAASNALRAKVHALILSSLHWPKSYLTNEAESAVRKLRLKEAIPVLEKMYAERAMPSSAAEASFFTDQEHGASLPSDTLAEIGGEEAVRSLLRFTYLEEEEDGSDEAMVGVLGALRELESPLAAPRMLELLLGKDNRRFEDPVSTSKTRTVRGMAAGVLLAIYPDGPKWPEKDDPADQQKAGEAWKEYLGKRGVPGRYQLPPEDAKKITRWLLGRAKHYARPVDHTRSIGRLLHSQRLLTGRTGEAAEKARSEIAKRLPDLARAEVAGLASSVHAAVFGKDLANTFSEKRPYKGPDAPLLKDLDGAYGFDPLRVTEKGYLDPWGNPYQYLKPGKHSKEPFEIYSFGPNGKDEDGEGDDIASWKQD